MTLTTGLKLLYGKQANEWQEFKSIRYFWYLDFDLFLPSLQKNAGMGLFVQQLKDYMSWVQIV